jgi:hypothetical protein
LAPALTVKFEVPKTPEESVRLPGERDVDGQCAVVHEIEIPRATVPENPTLDRDKIVEVGEPLLTTRFDGAEVRV